jgi:hypothetical protein
MNLLSLINPSLAHVYCSTTLSNHGLIRLKKFVSQSYRNLCKHGVITVHATGLASEPVILEPQSRVRLPGVLHDVHRWAVPWQESHAENVPTKNLRPRRWGARAPVFGAVVASAATRVVAMGGLLLIPPSAPAGVQGVVLLTFLSVATKNRVLNLSPATAPEMLVGIY